MADRGQPRLPGVGADGIARPRRMRRAVDLQLKTQQAMGQLEPVDEGLKAMARTLADAWDAEVADRDGSRYTEATIAGRMLPVLLELRGERHDSASDIAWDAELEQLKATIRDAARSRQDDDRA